MEKKIIEVSGNDIAISDGYHTFGELYNHRIELWLALVRQIVANAPDNESVPVWRSKKHDDVKKLL